MTAPTSWSDWTTKQSDAGPAALTQGSDGYVGQQRDTALAFAWQHAKEANDKAAEALTAIASLASTVEGVASSLATLTAALGTNGGTVTEERLIAVWERIAASLESLQALTIAPTGAPNELGAAIASPAVDAPPAVDTQP